jgi:drug/metabolite transporter (DMT)-like permease
MSDKNLIFGAFYTTLASLAVVLMATIVKWVSYSYSTEFLMVVRWFSGLAIFLVIYRITQVDIGLKTTRPFMQAAVALCWTGAIFCYYLSLRYIPMLDATLLLNTASLFASIIARVLARAREKGMVWVGTGVGFLGVIVALRPDTGIFNPMALVALASGLLMAFRIYFNRVLSETDPRERTTFYSLAIGVLVCALIWLFAGAHIGTWQKHLFTPAEALRPMLVDSVLTAAVVALGLLSMLQAYCTAFGLQYASVGQIAPFRYTAVIFAAIFDGAVWGQVPTITGFVGLGLIMLGGVITLRAKN